MEVQPNQVNNMFGAIASGRMIQNFEQIGETQFVTVIENADKINYVTVFLTGAIPFPQGTGGLVYFCWPDFRGPSNWQLLGSITEDKPSAIFRISNLKKEPAVSELSYLNTFGQHQFSHIAQIGISIEPMLQVQQQSASLSNESESVVRNFARDTIEKLWNYASSFAVSQEKITLNPNETYIPLSVLQKWYNNFDRRLQHNPNFWRI